MQTHHVFARICLNLGKKEVTSCKYLYSGYLNCCSDSHCVVAIVVTLLMCCTQIYLGNFKTLTDTQSMVHVFGIL